MSIPIVDIGPLVARVAARGAVADAIGAACREHGFFYATGHGVPADATERVQTLARAFFAQAADEKLVLSMERAGRAWRGYFPVGGELTSGRPDRKEGLYFGAELSEDDPRVLAGIPLHGPNLFPAIEGFRDAVLRYMAELTRLGHALLEGIALSLGLPADYFARRYTADPLVLFRIFNYPPAGSASSAWGVAPHTDYGLLTILSQDAGGLEVKTPAGWIAAPVVDDSFVCNIGDMLDRMTAGVYRSTLHRVRPPRERARLSLPFFFDPSFDAEIKPLAAGGPDPTDRWDGRSPHLFDGRYGDYLLGKIARVFPELGADALDSS